nr:MAG TPA: Protein of unknown function (DUF1642) [Caudoviricetes sp.]
MNKQELIEKYEYLNHDCFRRVDTSEVLKDLKQLDKSQKPVVKQFVADWYEGKKDNLDYNIWNYVYEWEHQEEDEFRNWFNHSNKAFQTLVNMHQFGYTVEKEKRYEVKLKNTDDYLVKTNNDDYRFYNNIYTNRRKHTRKEIEKAKFGWVFNCPGIEVKEVKE